jgi:histidine triad (HIT) family protein
VTMSDVAFDHACIFCRIAAREAPAEILHESDLVVAFRDANPKAPVHILLIPKEHFVSLPDVEDRHGGVLASLIQTAAHLAKAEGIAETGWRLVANVGPHAGQSVFHLHFHLLGGRPMSWPPG